MSSLTTTISTSQGLLSAVPLGSQLARILRRQIIAGDLAPGAKLIEGQLSEAFGVSRGPVRDALGELRVDGLVVSAGRSLVVNHLDESYLEDFYVLRESVELLAAQKARSNPAAVAAARTAVDRMRAAASAGDPESYNRADIDFHGAFFEHGSQIIALQVWPPFRRTLEAMLDLNPHPEGDLPRAADIHEELLDALLNGDDYAEALHQHVREAVGRLGIGA